MNKRLADHFRFEREKQGLSYADLARLMGYQGKGIVGGANKICQFEVTGRIQPSLLSRLAAILEIDPDLVERLRAEDEANALEEWMDWASRHIAPHIVVRLIPGVYQRRPLAEGISQMEAFEIMAEVAEALGCDACLVLSRHISYWFNSQGRVCGVNQRDSWIPQQSNHADRRVLLSSLLPRNRRSDARH